MRFLGTFLEDPLDVPLVVLDYIAAQLDVADPSSVKHYLDRRPTRFEHRWEIERVDGWSAFASHGDELSRWIDHWAWTTGSGPKGLFDEVVAWLRQRQVLLPAVRELERLVSRVLNAHRRLWEALAELVTARQAQLLLTLVEVPEGRCGRRCASPCPGTALGRLTALSVSTRSATPEGVAAGTPSGQR